MKIFLYAIMVISAIALPFIIILLIIFYSGLKKKNKREESYISTVNQGLLKADSDK